jgi:hypothetical protein
MKKQVYYTTNNQTTTINCLSFDRKKLLVIYTINGKKYAVKSKYRRFEIDFRKYYANL